MTPLTPDERKEFNKQIEQRVKHLKPSRLTILFFRLGLGAFAFLYALNLIVQGIIWDQGQNRDVLLLELSRSVARIEGQMASIKRDDLAYKIN